MNNDCRSRRCQYDRSFPKFQTHVETTVNYNRDIEIFPVLVDGTHLGEPSYASPTDKGVNMVTIVGQWRCDWSFLNKKSSVAITRLSWMLKQSVSKELSRRLSLDEWFGHNSNDRKVTVLLARQKEEETGSQPWHLNSPNGEMVTENLWSLWSNGSPLINAIEKLAHIDKENQINRARIRPTYLRLKDQSFG